MYWQDIPARLIDAVRAAFPRFDFQRTEFDFSKVAENLVYEITYTDGTEFERTLDTVEDVKRLHQQIELLSIHLASLKKKK